MSFPAYGTTVPSLQPYQFSFRGFELGPNTALEIKKINGADLPNVRTGDSERPRERGMFAGLDLLGGGELIIEGDLKADNVSFAHALQALSAATVPSGTAEYPLYMNHPAYGTLVATSRIRKRAIPIDIRYALGNLAEVSLLWAATDPCWYSTPTLSASVTPPGATAGFSFPLTFPLTFREASVAGVLSLNNEGDIDTKPIFTVEGPCTDPSITLASGEGSPNLTFELTLSAGDTLVIDTDMHTAMLYSFGSTIGSTRWYALAPGSKWFTLAKGFNTVQFLTSDPVPSGKLTVEYCSAWIV